MGRTTDSRIAENVLLFCRTLRKAGLPIGPGQVLDACDAILRTGVARRDDFYVALRAVLVSDPRYFRLFDQAFHVYFRNPRLLERMLGLLLPTLQREAARDGADAAIRRLLEAFADSAGNADREDDATRIEVDGEGSYSAIEVLREKDFEQMSLEEQLGAKALLREELQFISVLPTRRFRPDRHGRGYDMRRTMRLMLRNAGQPVELARKSRSLRPPTLVLVCDISGSMTSYSRMFLHFAHALATRRRNVHSFVFGTRLSNISAWLADADVDRAVARVAAEVRDWDGGTRIAGCLERFNIDWGRRVLSGRSLVILLSDGLERDSADNLGFQMQRLKRSTGQLIWLNPMLRYAGFEPKARGIRAMLPYVDRFLPAHNVNSLIDLGRLLGDAAASPARFAA